MKTLLLPLNGRDVPMEDIGIRELRGLCAERLEGHQLEAWGGAGGVSRYPARDWGRSLCEAALASPDGWAEWDGAVSVTSHVTEHSTKPVAIAKVAKPGGRHEGLNGEGAAAVDAFASLARVVAAQVLADMPAPAATLDDEAVRAIVRDVVRNEGRVIAVDCTRADRATIRVESPHALLPDLLKALRSRELHPYLWGPAGSGKTTLAQDVAKALGLEFFRICCNGATSERPILGGLHPINGRYQWSDVMRLYRDGGVVFFDELDATDSAVAIAIHAVTDSSTITVAGLGKVDKHPDFYVLAGGNTAGGGASRMYVGRNQLDGATLNRWDVWRVDYDAELERRIGDKAAVEWFQAARKVVRESRIARVCGTRDIVKASAGIAVGFTLDDMVGRYLSAWSADEVAKIKAAGLTVGTWEGVFSC